MIRWGRVRAEQVQGRCRKVARREQDRSRAEALYLFWPISALVQNFMGRSRSWTEAGAMQEQVRRKRKGAGADQGKKVSLDIARQ